jgi:hypothetical protein
MFIVSIQTSVHPQSSQTLSFALLDSSSFLLPSSFSASILFLSFSLTAFSYCLASSVFFGALTPSAPAIILEAVPTLFSGLLPSPPLLAEPALDPDAEKALAML